MKIAFLVPSLRLSGGLNVVMEHGSRLARDHDMDVTMVITHHPDEVPWTYDGLDDVSVRTLADAAGEPFDLVIATWWDTVTHLHRLPSKQYAYFVQSLEDRFFGPADPQGVLAGLTYRLGLPVITEARWIADLFEALQPEVPCFYVPNGINKDIFPVLAEVPDRPDGPLRVLVEGNVDDHIKGVPEALEAIGRMVEPTELTVVSAKGGTLPGAEVIGPISQRELSDVMARTDVVLKLSRVEGMAGPPLEGFHRGATAVITPVTGHDEYTQHGWNALVTGWDDPTGTARQLDLLAADPALLGFLRTNAVATAAAWPDWDRAAETMADAVRSIATASPHDLAATAPLLREARFQVARDSRRIHRLKERIAFDEIHIAKVEENWRVAGDRVQELSRLTEAQAARMDRVEAMLTELERSRWLRLFDRLEAPVQRRRDGLGTVRERLRSVRDTAREEPGS